MLLRSGTSTEKEVTTTSRLNLKDIPQAVLTGVRRLENIPHMNGAQKKEVLVRVLQEMCPNDTLDEIIPPLIDIVVVLIRSQSGYSFF